MRAGSTGRCNTIQRVDSAMLSRVLHLFGYSRPKPGQGSVPARLILASDFGFCFQCNAGSCLVSHRPIEITRLVGTWPRGSTTSCTVALYSILALFASLDTQQSKDLSGLSLCRLCLDV